jgi:hypothetical protein
MPLRSFKVSWSAFNPGTRFTSYLSIACTVFSPASDDEVSEGSQKSEPPRQHVWPVVLQAYVGSIILEKCLSIAKHIMYMLKTLRPSAADMQEENGIVYVAGLPKLWIY